MNKTKKTKEEKAPWMLALVYFKWESEARIKLTWEKENPGAKDTVQVVNEMGLRKLVVDTTMKHQEIGVATVGPRTRRGLQAKLRNMHLNDLVDVASNVLLTQEIEIF